MKNLAKNKLKIGLLIIGMIFVLTGCADPLKPIIEEKIKPYYVGKRITPIVTVLTYSNRMRVVRDGRVENVNLKAYDAIYTITDVDRDSYGYYLKARKQKDAAEYRIYTDIETLGGHFLPGHSRFGHEEWAYEDDFYKHQKEEEKNKKAEEAEKKKQIIALKKMYKKWWKAVLRDTMEQLFNGVSSSEVEHPEWAESVIFPNCPLAAMPATAVEFKCKDIKIKPLTEKRINIKMIGCVIGDIDFIFSYDSKFATPQKMTALGQNQYNFLINDAMMSDAVGFCMHGAGLLNELFKEAEVLKETSEEVLKEMEQIRTRAESKSEAKKALKKYLEQ